MKQRHLVLAALAVGLTTGAVRPGLASTSLAATNITSKTFDSRTFEYRGHIGYKHTANDGMGASRLDLQDHDSSQCGSAYFGVCIGNEYMKECRITAGSAFYDHSFKLKILINGQQAGSMWEVVLCNHANALWQRNVGEFAQASWGGQIGDTYTFRVTIRDANDVEKQSADVGL